LAADANYKVLVITPSEFSSRIEMRDRLIEHCEQAVTDRTGHATFDTLKIEDRLKFTRSFAEQFTPLQISEHIHLVEEMDFLKLNGSRRNIYQMRDELHRLILKNLYAKREPGCIVALLTREHRDLLQKSITKQVFKSSPNTKEYLHHLTFMHSNVLRKKRQLWDRLKDLRNEEVTIRVKSVVTSENNVVLECSVDDLNHTVSSGYPHITAYIDKEKSAFYSVTILKQLFEDEVDESIKQLVLDDEIVLKMKIDFMY